jgi:hypothetical protein
MIKTKEALFIFREDLEASYQKIHITNVGLFNCFIHIERESRHSNIIIFIDDNGDTRVIKNRYGKDDG